MLQTFMEDSRRESSITFVSVHVKTPHDEHGSYLKGQVGVLLFLPHLEAGQMGVFELQAVLLFEILGNGALHSLSVLELQRKSAGTCRERRKCNWWKYDTNRIAVFANTDQMLKTLTSDDWQGGA